MIRTSMIAHVFLNPLFITVNCLLLLAVVHSISSGSISDATEPQNAATVTYGNKEASTNASVPRGKINTTESKILSKPSAKGNETIGSQLNITTRVAGGLRVDIRDFPYLAIVRTRYWEDDAWQYSDCGGAIIGRRWILTAAHCVKKFDVQVGGVTVAVGVDHKDGVLRFRDTANLYVHPGHRDFETYSDDIALVKLGKALTYSNRVQRLRLPRMNAISEYEGRMAWLAGFGESAPNIIDPDLRAVEIRIIPQRRCLKYRPRLRNYFLCAGEVRSGKDACGGDSGSPLVLDRTNRPVVVGLVSSGDLTCGRIDKPGVYTRVSYYIKWICGIMKC